MPPARADWSSRWLTKTKPRRLTRLLPRHLLPKRLPLPKHLSLLRLPPKRLPLLRLR